MSKLNEIIDSLNDENVSETKEQLKSEADVLHNSNKQLYARAKRAEGFEYDKVKKDWAKKKVEKKEETKSKAKQSDEPDYAKLAFLEGKKVSHPDDQKLILDEAERLKLPLTDILNMEHIKGKLKDANDQREAKGGMPKGKGKAGGSSQQDVDYHLAKDKCPEDLELAEKYINAKSKKEEMADKFSEELYTG